MKLAKRRECLLSSVDSWVGRPHTESLFVLDSSKPHPPTSFVKFKVLLCRMVASLVYFKVAINRLLSDNLVLAQEPSFCSISTRASQDSRTSPSILSEKNSSSGKTLIKNQEVRQLYWFLAFCFIMVPQLRRCCVLVILRVCSDTGLSLSTVSTVEIWKSGREKRRCFEIFQADLLLILLYVRNKR